MRHMKLLLQGIVYMLVLVLLVACTAPEPSLTIESTLVIEPTATSKPAISIPSTPTEIIPTITETPTIEPTATFSPEVAVNEPEDIIGVWLVKILGGGEGDAAHLEFRDDGTWTLDGVSGYHKGMNFDFGTYTVEEGSLFLDSDYCFDPNSATYEFYHCTGEYRVSVRKQFGYPVRIHFTVIEDYGGDRQLSLNGKTFSLVEQ